MNKRMQCLALLLVVGMFAAAGWLEEKALIFPEIAAVACGAWVMRKPPWRFSALTVWLSPSLAALSGVLILRFLPASPVWLISGAFVAVALQLKVTRSAVIPSLSAAILPIITNVDTLWYPASVCILTGLIALVHLTRSGSEQRRGNRAQDEGATGADASALDRLLPNAGSELAGEGELAKWGKLTVGVFLVALVALRAHLLFMVAPPLIVTFVELSKPESALRQKLWQLFALLLAAAFAGVLQLHLIHVILHCPVWLSAAVSLGTVFLLYHLFTLPFPPAAAIALLPTIIPADALWYYPWQVLLGSAAFITLSLLLFKAEDDAVAAAEES